MIVSLSIFIFYFSLREDFLLNRLLRLLLDSSLIKFFVSTELFFYFYKVIRFPIFVLPQSTKVILKNLSKSFYFSDHSWSEKSLKPIGVHCVGEIQSSKFGHHFTAQSLKQYQIQFIYEGRTSSLIRSQSHWIWG